jgi:16S rRNA (guanine966-N2)-methyltransferase
MRILAGRFHGRALPLVAGDVRPAGARLRTSLFGVLAPRLDGARVLDVCAGAGALGLEALSRGAAHVTLLDRDPRVVAGLAAWLAKVGASGEARVVCADALHAAWPAGPFDLVLLDPPFPAWQSTDAAALLTRARGVLSPGGLLAAKLPRRQELPEVAGLAVADRRDAADVAFALLEPV